jgi:spore coat polysaccharide biosynthesis protein SpsF
MSKNKLGLIVQARMGSTRLPGKVLKVVGDRPLLQHVIERSNKIKTAHELIIATSDQKADDEIVKFCDQRSVPYFRGSELNVLERYYKCAEKFQLAHIVRLTADNPYFDFEELDQLLRQYFGTDADYANNFEFLPVGVGTEVMSFKALEKSYSLGLEPHHREHVNEFILENSTEFKSIKVRPTNAFKIRPDLRMTVDTWADLENANLVFRESKGEVTTDTIIRVLSRMMKAK